MTIVHMVFFKFQEGVSAAHKQEFIRGLKQLKKLSCVKDHRLIVGGPSVTDPIERSKGFQYALLSFHQNDAALAEYQASTEHHNVVSKLFFPYKEDLCRFDFRVDEEDEHMCDFLTNAVINGHI